MNRQDDWWRTDEPPDYAENPEVVKQREMDAKRPAPGVVLAGLRKGGTECVDLSAQDLEPDYFFELCRSLIDNTHVTRVYLGASCKGIASPKTWEAVAHLIAFHPTLSRWSLAKTTFTFSDVEVLSHALTCSKAVTSVDLANCKGIHFPGGMLLLNAVRDNSCITCLYVGGTDIPEALCEAIRQITTMRRAAG